MKTLVNGIVCAVLALLAVPLSVPFCTIFMAIMIFRSAVIRVQRNDNMSMWELGEAATLDIIDLLTKIDDKI